MFKVGCQSGFSADNKSRIPRRRPAIFPMHSRFEDALTLMAMSAAGGLLYLKRNLAAPSYSWAGNVQKS